MAKGNALSETATDQVRKLIREDARRLVNARPHRGRWQGAEEATGGGGNIIAFQIVNSDPTNFSAYVQIRQRSFLGEVYGSDLGDTVVDVYDTDGCYLNEPNVDLTDRKGHAVLVYTDDEAEALHFAGYGGAAPERYWKVIGLCCANTSCD